MLLEDVGNSAECVAALSTGALHLHCSADPDLNCKKPRCNLYLAKLCTFAQVHMLFQVKGSSKADGRHQIMDMLLVRYYDACPLEDCDRDVDLSLQHLVWKEGGAKTGRKENGSHATRLWIAFLLYGKPAYVHISRIGMN